MSVDNLHPSKIPIKPCHCVHHHVIPCPSTADPKLKPKCCHCKKNRKRPKSSEKESTIPDESMAGEPHVDDPGVLEKTSSSRKLRIDELLKELFTKKTKVDDLGKDLVLLKNENETLKKSRDDALTQISSLQEEISKFTNENKSLELEYESLKNQISDLTNENESLRHECEGLKDELKSVQDREERRNTEISDEVQKMRNVIREKENSLIDEKNELNTRISELTDTVKQQKKKISELMSICAKQKSKIEENEKKINFKTTELSDTEKRFKSKCCECTDLQEEIETLKTCLNDESRAANDFKKEMDECKDNCKCELLTKDKLIEDQTETIKRLKNILKDNEKLALHAAREFEQLTDELYSTTQENNDLKMTLEEISENFESKKSKCSILEKKLNYLSEQKEKALIAAKYAAKKLCEATDEFHCQLNSEKQQQRFLMSVVKQKEKEIECLKKEINHMRLCK